MQNRKQVSLIPSTRAHRTRQGAEDAQMLLQILLMSLIAQVAVVEGDGFVSIQQGKLHALAHQCPSNSAVKLEVLVAIDHIFDDLTMQHEDCLLMVRRNTLGSST